MVDGQIFFDQPVKKNNNNNLRTYDNVQNITIGQWDHYTTGSLRYHPCFKEKLITTDLSKQQPLDVDPKAIQQIILLEI